MSTGHLHLDWFESIATKKKNHTEWCGFFLVKENHQPGWWFQKALAMSRKNILL